MPDRAEWTRTKAKILMDLLVKEKEILNWSDNGIGPTKLGWNNVCSEFNRRNRVNYDVQQLQRKLQRMKQSFNKWLAKQKPTDLDNITWEENEELNRNLPFCYAQLAYLFGLNPNIGLVIHTGGNPDSNLKTSSKKTDSKYRSGVPLSQNHASSVVESPLVHWSIESMRQCAEQIRDSLSQFGTSDNSDAERNQVFKVLEEDGIEEGTELHIRTTTICQDPDFRKTYLMHKTKISRAGWIEENYPIFKMKLQK